MKQRYQQRNKAVIDFFNKNNGKLLVIDVTNTVRPWVKLATFLGKPVPGVPFPYINKTPHRSSFTGSVRSGGFSVSRR